MTDCLKLFTQNVSIDNFGQSFSDGLAFCALLHHFIPDQIPYSKLDASNRVSLSSNLHLAEYRIQSGMHGDNNYSTFSQLQEQNFRIAFEEAEKVGIPRLLVSQTPDTRHPIKLIGLMD